MTALRIALPSGCTWRVCSSESWNRRRVWWWKPQLRINPFSSTSSSGSQVRRLLFTVSSSSSSTRAARGVELRSIARRCYATTGFQGLSPAVSSSSSSSAAECRQRQQEARGIGSISAAAIYRLQRREEGHSILSVPNGHAHRGAELQAISSRGEECRLLEDAKLKKRIAEESVVETKDWFWSQILAQIKLKQWIDSKRLVYSSDAAQEVTSRPKEPEAHHSQRAVVVALWCNFLVFSLKIGVWSMTSSHVMLAESIHSLADLANQALLAYGLVSSKRAPDALHPYGYSKERFVWSLISAVGIFCLGSGATIVHGVQNLWNPGPVENVSIAAGVLVASAIMEGASLIVAYGAVKKGAEAEGMTLKEYLWRGHDPTAVAVMMEDGAAVAGLAVAGLALAAVEFTGQRIWDPIGSIVVGQLLGVVAIFLIQRNRQALLGRSIDDLDMRRVINLLISDPVVEGLYDCKSEVIGPGAYRFKAEIDFNGVVIVQNYLQRAGRDAWMKDFLEAAKDSDSGALDRVMASYGEEVVAAVGSEIDRLEKEIQRIVPAILHVDIEAHNPNGPVPREKFYLHAIGSTK
ncbi:unnamed protein product [Sphagnum jensenii]|uniref:Cation efflux protein transmembrane domain-containing protein n=1 Tax=Sphagnum jensenii TaxID=128206 RepID=A0ABP1B4B5_9BRYO